MRCRRARVAALALPVLVVSAGCSGLTAESVSAEAAVALEWAEHLCEGRYSEAHALATQEARLDEELYPGVVEALAASDDLAADRLAALEADGTSVTSPLRVEEVRPPSQGHAVVRVTGPCWGEELGLSLDVIEQDGSWLVDRFPFWAGAQLFVHDDYSSFAALDIEHGARLVPGDESDNDLWVLLPGQHDVEVPAHFLVGEAWQTEVRISGLLGIDRAVLPEIAEAPLGTAYTDFVTACGEACVVTPGAEEQPGVSAPVTVEPVSGAEVTYSGDALLIRPTGQPPEFFEPLPGSWGRESPDTATVRLVSRALERTDLTCDTGECTVVVADELDEADSVRRLWLVDTGDGAAVSGLD